MTCQYTYNIKLPKKDFILLAIWLLSGWCFYTHAGCGNTVALLCSQTLTNQSTLTETNAANSFDCYTDGFGNLIPLPGKDRFYAISVETDAAILRIGLTNVTDNDPYLVVFLVGVVCSNSICDAVIGDWAAFNIANGTFTDTNLPVTDFNVPTGGGTYYLVIDSEGDGVTQYDISTDCFASGIEFDTDGLTDSGTPCAGATGNGYTTLWNNNDLYCPSPGQSGQLCYDVYIENSGWEWVKYFDVQVGNCWQNLSSFYPDGINTGFYNTGDWDAYFDDVTQTIHWEYTRLDNPAHGDGNDGDYDCYKYTFCFTGDIDLACTNPEDLDIVITITDDGIGLSGSTKASSIPIYTNVGFSPQVNINPPEPNLLQICQNQTFTFNAIAAGASGIYTLYEWKGILTPNLSNTNSLTTTLNTTGLQPGTYPLLLEVTDQTGCVGSHTIDVVVHPLPTAPLVLPMTLCFGQALPDLSATGSGAGYTLVWYAQNPDLNPTTLPIGTGNNLPPLQYNAWVNTTVPGIYTIWVNQTNPQNCASLATALQITVQPQTMPPIPVPVFVCQNSPLPNLITTGIGQPIWYATNPDIDPLALPIGFGNPLQASNYSSYVNTGLPGSYSLWATLSENNCPSIAAELIISVLAPAVAPFTQNPAAICAGQSLPNLSATVNNGGSITWYATNPTLDPTSPVIGNGSTLFSADYATFVNNGNAPGNYTFWVVEMVNGCASQAAEVVVSILPTPALTVFQPATICAGQVLPSLSATSIDSIYWYNQDPDSNPGAILLGLGSILPGTNLSGLIADNTIPGIYTVWVQATNGSCNSLAQSITITIEAIPLLNPIPDLTLCALSTDLANIGLTGQNLGLANVSYHYDNSGQPGAQLTGSIVNTSGSYWVVVSLGNCTDVQLVNIILNTPEIANFTLPVAAACTTDPTFLPIFDPQTTTSGIFSATPSGLAFDNLSGLIVPANSVSGNYTLTYTTSGTCVATFSQNISIQNQIIANFTLSANDYCLGSNNAPPFVNSIANPGGNFSISGSATIDSLGQIDTASLIAPNTYTITYTTNGNCPDTATQTLTTYIAPNAGQAPATLPLCNGNNAIQILADLLINEDSNGLWSETSATPSQNNAFNAINGSFNALGQLPGIYTFNYMFTDPLGLCNTASTTATIEVFAPDTAQLLNNVQVCNAPVGIGCELNIADLISNGNSNGTWTDIDNSGAIFNAGIWNFNGVSPGNYTFSYTLPNAAPCSDMVYFVEVLVENCLCPPLAISAVPDICNTQTLNLSTYQLTPELGTWTIINAPLGNNPAFFLPDGITIDANNADPGMYEISFTLQNPLSGCPADTIITITIFEQPTADFLLPTSLCLNAPPIDLISSLTANSTSGGSFTINGISTNALNANNWGTGSINVEYVVSNGVCSANFNQNIIINPLPDPAWLPTNPTICAEAAPIDLNSLLLPNATPGGTWTINGNLATQFNAAALGQGNFDVTYTAQSNNCDSSQTHILTVLPLPPVGMALSDTLVCTNQQITINYTEPVLPGMDFVWTIEGGNPSELNSPGPHTISWPTAGTYSVTLVAALNGCAANPITNLVTVIEPLVTPEPFCLSSTINSITFGWNEVIGNTGYLINWAGGSEILPPTELNWTINNLQPNESATITIMALGNAPCGNSLTSAAVNCVTNGCPPVNLQTNLNETVLCADAEPVAVIVYPEGGDLFGAGVIDGQFYPEIVGEGQYILLYKYTDINSACSYDTSFTLTVLPLPNANFGTNATWFCLGDTLKINPNGVSPSDALLYWDLDGLAPDFSGWNIPGTVLTKTGNFALNLTVEKDGCFAFHTDSVHVTNIELDINATSNILQTGQSALITSEVTATHQLPYSLTWATTDTAALKIAATDIATATIHALYPGNYSIVAMAQNSLGCIASDSLLITVNTTNSDTIRWVLPTAFSPNDDGINDRLTLIADADNAIFQEYKLKIYDRYGKNLFSGAALSGWDGKDKNKHINIGVYSFILYNEKNEVIRHGNISLIR